jgi:hypothetical protein
MSNTAPAQARPAPDMLRAFTGVSTRQVVEAMRALVARRGDLETELIERLTAYPMESAVGFLLSASAAFYLAERNANPKIKTYVDALYYISTCLSVGYADIFAQTQAGRAIATLTMTVGPALTSEILDKPHKAEDASAANQKLIIERLDAILEELRKQNDEGQRTKDE